jgi:hypothetical protein
MLKVNSSLTSLSIIGYDIGNTAAFAVAEALKVNPSLTSIDHRSNSIRVEMAPAQLLKR